MRRTCGTAVAGTSYNSVTLKWNEQGTATGWNIEYGETGFTLGNGETVHADANLFTIENLTAFVEFDFYVQAECGSEFVGPVKATPGQYNFGTTGNASITGCDLKLYDNGGPNGQYSNYCNFTLTVYPEEDAGVVKVTGTLKSESGYDKMTIYDGVGTSGTQLGQFSGTQSNINVMSLSGPLTINFYSDLSTTNDGFELTVSCVSCLPPYNLELTDILTTSATISWEGGSENYVVEYGPAGFTPGTGTTENVENATALEIEGLTPTTQYTAYVWSNCGNEEMSDSVIINFTTLMVAEDMPYSTDFANVQDWLLNNGSCSNKWKMGTPSGASSNALFITSDNSSAGYNLYNSSTVMAEKLFHMPATDSVRLGFDVRVGGESRWDYLKVLLVPATAEFTPGSGHNTYSEYDNSNYALNFSDYKSQTSNSSYPYILNLSNSTIHVNVAMPNPDVNGQGKIVFLWSNDNSTGTQPGAVISNFQIRANEGDVVEITDPTVSTNAATDVTQTSATLKATITNPDNVTITAKGFAWRQSSAGATVYEVQGTGAGSTFTAQLNNLQPATSYICYAFITYNGTTVYGNEVGFTTQETVIEPCDVPSGIEVSNNTDMSATLTWNNAEVESWNVQYGTVGGALTHGNATTNTFPLENLAANTTYQVQVQSDCGDGNTSEWSEPVTFTTTTGLNDFVENSVDLYPNPANDLVCVELKTDNKLMQNVLIYDVYGKLVGEIVPKANIARINVASLASGMYFVKVVTGSGTVTKQFVRK